MRTGRTLATALVAYHNAVEPLVAPRRRAAAGLGVAGAALALARGGGSSWEELGMARSARGLRWGLACAAAAGAAVAALLASPAGRRRFRDRRFDDLDAKEVAFHTLVRIPLGTALAEEAAFRGALQGMLAREVGPRAALVGTSVAFGLWHIAPALAQLEANRPEATAGERVRAVTGQVAATAAGGLALGLLRERSGGIVAPAIAHWAGNALATLGAVATRPSPVALSARGR